MTTEERIALQATKHEKYRRLFQNMDRDYIVWEDGYVTGAKSERNNTIDYCKSAIVEYWGKLHTRMRSEDRDEIRAILDSLKVNP